MSLDGKDTKTGFYKGLPQHIKAAKLLVDLGRDLKAGDIVSYVKTTTGDGVKPVELSRPEEVDTQKYVDAMEATFDQLLSSLNFNFKSLLGKPRQSSLDDLFWDN
jgi:DNA polymerase I